MELNSQCCRVVINDHNSTEDDEVGRLASGFVRQLRRDEQVVRVLVPTNASGESLSKSFLKWAIRGIKSTVLLNG